MKNIRLFFILLCRPTLRKIFKDSQTFFNYYDCQSDDCDKCWQNKFKKYFLWLKIPSIFCGCYFWGDGFNFFWTDSRAWEETNELCYLYLKWKFREIDDLKNFLFVVKFHHETSGSTCEKEKFAPPGNRTRTPTLARWNSTIRPAVLLHY